MQVAACAGFTISYKQDTTSCYCFKCTQSAKSSNSAKHSPNLANPGRCCDSHKQCMQQGMQPLLQERVAQPCS